LIVLAENPGSPRLANAPARFLEPARALQIQIGSKPVSIRDPLRIEETFGRWWLTGWGPKIPPRLPLGHRDHWFQIF